MTVDDTGTSGILFQTSRKKKNMALQFLFSENAHREPPITNESEQIEEAEP